MKALSKLALVVGSVLVVGTVAYHVGKTASDSVNKYLDARIAHELAQPTAAPPGWDYCTMPSYYIRACEASPYTRRWTGADPGTCPVTAICGAHTRSCGGDDGITYAMMDQGGARYYPKPQDSAGPIIIQQWIDCYVNKIDVFGSVYPCHAVNNAPGGRQAPSMLTLSQLPAGSPQIPSFCSLYHCLLPICGTGGTPSPSPSMTRTVPALCPTCPPSSPSRTPTKTFTPHIGPAPSKTFTPHFGPAKTPTPTPKGG